MILGIGSGRDSYNRCKSEGDVSVNLPDSNHDGEDAERKQWEAAVAFFRSIEPQLAADPRLLGQYVAIHGERVIDQDVDRFQLARRIAGGFPTSVVLIVRAGCQAGLEISSPEIAI
jgi:hypothetical protein